MTDPLANEIRALRTDIQAQTAGLRVHQGELVKMDAKLDQLLEAATAPQNGDSHLVNTLMRIATVLEEFADRQEEMMEMVRVLLPPVH